MNKYLPSSGPLNAKVKPFVITLAEFEKISLKNNQDEIMSDRHPDISRLPILRDLR